MTFWRESLIARVGAMHRMWTRGVADLTVAQVNHVMFDGQRPAGNERSFIEHLVPSGPLRRGDLAEAWIYQHGIRHLGELEHARALVGLGGIS